MSRNEPSVLVVEDEDQVRRFLRSGLSLHGFTVLEASSIRAGLELASLRRPDLIVLDLELPDGEGSEFLAHLREWSRAPVLVLSVRDSEDEKVRLLESGADDYVTKPFGMAELMARLKVMLRRAARAETADPVVRLGDLTIDLPHRIVSREGRPLDLTPKEFVLLKTLAAQLGKVMTHRQLLQAVWGDPGTDAQYLRILVRKLRAKIERDPARPAHLVTELGVGYRLKGDAPPA